MIFLAVLTGQGLDMAEDGEYDEQHDEDLLDEQLPEEETF